MRLPRRSLALLALAPLPVALVTNAPTASADVATGPAVQGVPAAQAARPVEAAARQIVYTQWDGGQEFRTGRLDGVRFADTGRRAGRLLFDEPAGTRSYAGRSYDAAHWTSPWVTPGVSFTELIASWSARTPGDSWIEVRVRGRDADRRTSSWDVLGRWTAGDRYLRRATVKDQDDDLASVDADTWKAPAGLTSYQLSVTLLRRHGSTSVPTLDTVGAVASRLPDSAAGSTSRPGVARGVELDVPQYSQMIHRGEYPRWNGGGEAWCSPTSTSMVLGYYHALPRPASYRWVGSGHADPWVDLAARSVFDYSYDGTGNWPFNTAYAANLAGHGFVTRLRSLREAERFVRAGIPLVASIAFSSGGLDGAPVSSTAGHLVVIRGFTDAGDVVVNDPAAATDAGVRHVYRRAQFERAWVGGSGGVVYVIHDDAHPLPAGEHSNW